MADEGLSSQRRDPIKSSVGPVAATRRRQQAVSVGKERREALMRAKRLCRVGVIDDFDAPFDGEMMIEEDQSVLEAQTSSAVDGLKIAIAYQGKGAMQKRVNALRELRRLLSRSEFPPVEAALKADVVPLLVQCLAFGSPDEQLLEAAWCLTNIAAGKPEETKALLPALPLLIAHLGEKSSLPVAEQCAWAIGNVAGEGDEFRKILLAQGALTPLARMMLPDKGSTVRTAAWALSNLIKVFPWDLQMLRKFSREKGMLGICLVFGKYRLDIFRRKKAGERERGSKNKSTRNVEVIAASLIASLEGPDPRVSTDLIRIDGVLDSITRHLKKADEELATEVAWVVVYLSALSNVAVGLFLKSDLLQSLAQRLAASNSLQLLIPVLRSLGNLVAGDAQTVNYVLVAGQGITNDVISALVKCLGSEHRVLKKEAAWVLSNIAAGSVEHKQLIYSSEAVPLLLRLLLTAPFDIKKEVAYVLGNLCVAPSEGTGRPTLILEHLVSLVGKGCLPGFIDLIRSADTEAARLGLQFMELVLRGMPNGDGPKLVENEDGIEAMERFQFHENEHLRNMANELVDKYFGENYGLDDDE